jgi:hypothetical protein
MISQATSASPLTKKKIAVQASCISESEPRTQLINWFTEPAAGPESPSSNLFFRKPNLNVEKSFVDSSFWPHAMTRLRTPVTI